MRLKLKSYAIRGGHYRILKMGYGGFIQMGFLVKTTILQIKADSEFNFPVLASSLKLKPHIDHILLVTHFGDDMYFVHKTFVFPGWEFVYPNKPFSGVHLHARRRVQVEHEAIHVYPASHSLDHHPAIDRHFVVQVGGQHAIVFGDHLSHSFGHPQHSADSICQQSD